MAIVDEHSNIRYADSEAITAFRGPSEGWNDDEPVTLRDNSCSGLVSNYWTAVELQSVGNSDGSDGHHYLVVQRADDQAVCWIQVCIHASPADDGRPLYAWYVRDISCSARCLEMGSQTTSGEYTLSLEDDGFPFSSLLTHEQPEDSQPCEPAYGHPLERAVRDQLAALLSSAVRSECFAVLYMTGFGAIDAVFPRRLLGWAEADLLDRSFIGLLSPDDRTFFCRVLRRCNHDGIPQRLILKVACADGFASGSQGSFVDCDVTVLIPESVQQPVLIVRATDQQPLSASICPARPPLLHTVQRVQLLESGAEEGSGSNTEEKASAQCLPSSSTRAGFNDTQMPAHMADGGMAGTLCRADENATPPLSPSSRGHDIISRLPSAAAQAKHGHPRALATEDTLVEGEATEDELGWSAEYGLCDVSIAMSSIFAYAPDSMPVPLQFGQRQQKAGRGPLVEGSFDSLLDRLNIGAIRPTPH
ncbi:hypothetical protein LPJ53_005208 [Coemansia erecta]|uniref:PAS domain-containing protein n=1 Tax=Coemansia erecta TaxID=147472 RepID=A0A9W7XX81_9FUNG|nr:hypothetical protein LPJ53_005208 [Coemansia erecta]